MANNETLKNAIKTLKVRRQNAAYNTFNNNDSAAALAFKNVAPVMIFEASDSISLKEQHLDISGDITSEVQKTEDKVTNSDEIDVYKTYMDDVSKYPLLDAKDEKILGEKIFRAKFSLRTLQKINEYLPTDEQTKIANLISKNKRAKYLLNVLSTDIAEKDNTIQRKQKEGKDASFDIAFKEDVKTFDKSLEQKIKDLLSIEDEKVRKQKILEFTNQEINSFNEGDQAFDSFSNSNLRLVVPLIKRYHAPGISKLDLIQEGNEGMMRAVAGFDYRRGFKFSTSATWWIKQFASRAAEESGHQIRLPLHMSEIVNALGKEQDKLQQEEGRYISATETAKKLGIDSEFVKSAIRSREVTSLDGLADTHLDKSNPLADLIPDETEDATSRAITNEVKEKVRNAVLQLTERERKIIELRFGLEDGQSQTLQQVGEVFNITRERARQIEDKAIRKLRHPKISRKLNGLLE